MLIPFANFLTRDISIVTHLEIAISIDINLEDC